MWKCLSQGENCALLNNEAASCCNSLLTFRDEISVPSSIIKYHTCPPQVEQKCVEYRNHKKYELIKDLDKAENCWISKRRYVHSLLPPDLTQQDVRMCGAYGTLPRETLKILVDSPALGWVFLLTYLLTSWSSPSWKANWFLQLVKKFPSFLEPEGSSPYPQAPATCPYPEPTPSSPHNSLPLPEDPS